MAKIEKLDIAYLRTMQPPSEAVVAMANTVNELIEVANAALLGAKVQHAGDPDRPTQPIAENPHHPSQPIVEEQPKPKPTA